jgi:glycerol-3-phosphate dehydrogenase
LTANRAVNLRRLKESPLDVLIAGGGINGAGIARDLALRACHTGHSLRIGLVERSHFASGTSGKNSQLIHGGLRYLKYLEFGLVREALRERATLLQLAPHLVEPLPFLIPMYSRFDRLFYGAGLYLYDALAGGRRIGRHRQLSAADVETLEPGLARDGLAGAACFYDCRVHAARFVLENVLESVENGVLAVNYVRLESVARDGEGLWQIRLRDTLTDDVWITASRAFVDARGPWARDGELRLVRGSHLVLPRVTASDYAIAHFDESGRVVFLIPWGSRSDLTLVGTTDVDHGCGPDDVRISPDETNYLLGVTARLFPAARLQPVGSYSSLRPLLRDSSESPTSVSRDHRIWRDESGAIRIAGGKYTTYRVMSEQAADHILDDIAPDLASVHLTASTPLRRRTAPASELMQVTEAVESEMAQRLADVMFVSTYLGYEHDWTASALEPYAAEMARLLGWPPERARVEIALVLRIREGSPWPAEARS